MEGDLSLPLQGSLLCAGGASITLLTQSIFDSFDSIYSVQTSSHYALYSMLDMHDTAAVSVSPAGDDHCARSWIVLSWGSWCHRLSHHHA